MKTTSRASRRAERTGERAAARAAATVADPRWRAVLARDAGADGAFVFAVRTTGVCCRPSCSARRARPEHVEFFADVAAAVRAGYRPCRRCRPDAEPPAARRAQLVARLCRTIEAAERAPTLRELAATAGLSPFHLQRLFRAVVGLTPHAYAAACRADRARTALARGATVTAALHGAGYGSTSRFYADAHARLGMLPRRFRRGGPGEVLEFGSASCSLGTVLVATTARGVAAILLGDEPKALEQDLRQRFPRAQFAAGGRAFRATLGAVVAFVDADRGRFALPLDLRGTTFQRAVWQALQSIPRGSTVGYAQLAARLGRPNGTRAVARACAQNPLAIVVPCHRVVRGDGDLAGYRWGLERKRALLAREGAVPAKGEP
ncbi:MAG: bifunctional DNA-binding transcriptional regulator/O6-methylguanine-DNA methyltransferase Ada [Planctomycetes bacterium]|nr:bifunctional DNA-binding transcriptional regulator/O6-methylguanine-DNA methyltransferase Ada [Planctomycetota bacterium]